MSKTNIEYCDYSGCPHKAQFWYLNNVDAVDWINDFPLKRRLLVRCYTHELKHPDWKRLSVSKDEVLMAQVHEE